MNSKRIEVSIKEITEKSESKKMEVSSQFNSILRLSICYKVRY
jgi:RNase P/RNase MRP subunit p30